MSNLWAEDSSITLNGTAHVGKTAVLSFFTSGGYFLNNWVSLAPEYKTQITVCGDEAQATTQCVAVDISASPFVASRRRPGQCDHGIGEKGQWFFTSMNNTSPASL